MRGIQLVCVIGATAAAGPYHGQLATVTLPGGSTIQDLTFCDANGDGTSDLLVATSTGVTLVESDNVSPGGFGVSVVGGMPAGNYRAIASFDWKAAAGQEFLLVRDEGATSTVIGATLAGTTLTPEVSVSIATNGQARIAAGRFLLGVQGSAAVTSGTSIYLVTSDGSALASTFVATPYDLPWFPAPGDLDADGLDDLAVSEVNPVMGKYGTVEIYRATGSPTSPFSLLQSVGNDNIGQSALLDANGDSRADLVVSECIIQPCPILVYLNGGGSPPFSTFTVATPSLRVGSFADADLDGASGRDLLLAASPGLMPATNDGSGSYQIAGALWSLGSGTVSSSNGDVAQFGGGAIWIYERDGSGAHQSGDSLLVGDAIGNALVQACSGNGVPMWYPFYPYSGNRGVNVATGALQTVADPVLLKDACEVLTGPGPSPSNGPHVRGFLTPTVDPAQPISKISYYAYGTLRFGVNVTAGALDGDAFDEIVTGAGPGGIFGPHVRGWNFDDVQISALPRCSAFVYSTLKWGVNVWATHDVDGDGMAEILTMPGPGAIFAPQARGFDYDGTAFTAIAKVNFNAFAGLFYGGRIASGDWDADGIGEIGCLPGPGAGAAYAAEIRGFDYDGASVVAIPGFDLTGFTSQYGGLATGADFRPDDPAIGDAVVLVPGPDPTLGMLVTGWENLQPVPQLSFEAYPGAAYGATIVAGPLF
ncbi:MAG: hypothetical protein U0166_10900 [Acidobacteriota bacterium]